MLLASCKFTILLPSPRRHVSAAGAELERGLIQLRIVCLVYLHTHAWYIQAHAELVPSYSKHAHADMSHLHPWLMSKLSMHRHTIAQNMDCGARPTGSLARLGTCKARAWAHIMRIRACRGSDSTGLAHAHACSHASNIIIALCACLPAHAGPIHMGTMPSPALLPVIQFMGRQPADPQPAPAHSSPTSANTLARSPHDNPSASPAASPSIRPTASPTTSCSYPYGSSHTSPIISASGLDARGLVSGPRSHAAPAATPNNDFESRIHRDARFTTRGMARVDGRRRHQVLCHYRGRGQKEPPPPPSPTSLRGYRASPRWLAPYRRNIREWSQNFWRTRARSSSAIKTTTASLGCNTIAPSGGTFINKWISFQLSR